MTLFFFRGKSKSFNLFSFRTEFMIPKKEIPFRLDDFSTGLETIFGLATKQI